MIYETKRLLSQWVVNQIMVLRNKLGSCCSGLGERCDVLDWGEGKRDEVLDINFCWIFI